MKDEKPERLKNRLAKQGADHLSTEELLTILFEKESTTNLLTTFDGNVKEIFTASIEELMKVKGIGFARACKIQVIFELIKRILSYRKEDHPQIESTVDVIMLLAPHMMYLKQEEFRVILLDSKNRLIRTSMVSLGSLDSAFVHPRDVFRPAIVHGAASIILVHNHPSGDPEPSESDILLTRDLYMSSKVVDVEILDHVIIGFLDYVSMKNRNLLKFPEVGKELNKGRKVFIALKLICNIGSNMLQYISAVLGGIKMGEKKKILKLFGATGTMEVLEYLAQHNTAHYRQMEEHVNSFTLNRRLRELLSFNLVDHHIDKTEARKEWYSLTEKGRKVVECIWDVIDIMNDEGM